MITFSCFGDSDVLIILSATPAERLDVCLCYCCSATVAGDEAVVPRRTHCALLIRLQPHGLLHAQVLPSIPYSEVHHLPQGQYLKVTHCLQPHGLLHAQVLPSIPYSEVHHLPQGQYLKVTHCLQPHGLLHAQVLPSILHSEVHYLPQGQYLKVIHCLQPQILNNLP